MVRAKIAGLLMRALLVVFLPLSAIEEVPSIEVHMGEGTEGLDRPLVGVITISHPLNARIDLESFEMDGKLLRVDFVKQVEVSKNQQRDGVALSIYRFELASKPSGHYVLNPIFFKIDEKIFHSDPLEYDIEKPALHSAMDKNFLFELEAVIEKPEVFFPGQRGRFIYRIYFDHDLDVTYSELPLLEAKGFLKIGDKKIQEAQDEKIKVQEISQEVEALTPGLFSFGTSSIEGVAYEQKVTGKKIYWDKKLKAVAASLAVQVTPFPSEHQPRSFSGMIGDLDMSLTLLSNKKMQIGEKVRLKMDVRSHENLDRLTIPNLACQPGMSGFFLFEKLSLELVQNNFKSFIITMEPQTTLVEAIPSFEIATFDPIKTQYSLWQSKPIAIEVTEEVPVPSIRLTDQLVTPKVLNDLEKKFKNRTAHELELKEPIQLTEADLKVPWMQSVQVLWIIPIGAIVIFLQLAIKRLKK